MISKKEFCEYIEHLKNFDEFDDRLFSLFNNVHGGIDTPDIFYYLCNDIIKLLSNSFDSKHSDWIKEDIDYFCNELEYGKKYKPGMVTDKDENGKEIKIDFSTSEKLYEYLISIKDKE